MCRQSSFDESHVSWKGADDREFVWLPLQFLACFYTGHRNISLKQENTV